MNSASQIPPSGNSKSASQRAEEGKGNYGGDGRNLESTDDGGAGVDDKGRKPHGRLDGGNGPDKWNEQHG